VFAFAFAARLAAARELAPVGVLVEQPQSKISRKLKNWMDELRAVRLR